MRDCRTPTSYFVSRSTGRSADRPARAGYDATELARPMVAEASMPDAGGHSVEWMAYPGMAPPLDGRPVSTSAARWGVVPSAGVPSAVVPSAAVPSVAVRTVAVPP